MPDPEELGIAEGTPMSLLVKALEARETARKIGGMVRSVQDFLDPCPSGKRRSKETGKCPEEEDQDDDATT
jgi:hypothetical protein